MPDREYLKALGPKAAALSQFCATKNSSLTQHGIISRSRSLNQSRCSRGFHIIPFLKIITVVSKYPASRQQIYSKLEPVLGKAAIVGRFWPWI